MVATTKQLDFISTLTGRAMTDTRPLPMTPASERAQRLAVAVLVTMLPTPDTTAEASGQIDALMGGTAGVQAYAGAHRAWATPILMALHGTLGKGDGIPRHGVGEWYGEGSEMPVSQWTAYVATIVEQVRGGGVH